MPMRPYLVICSRPSCGKPARFKIASRWSDGVSHDLKTYALSCESCLAAQFACARKKQACCRLTAGETLDIPGVYELARGIRDTHLLRRTDLEEHLLESSESH